MELEADALLHFLRQLLAVTPVCSFICQLRQIVGFELNAIQLVVAAEFIDFLLTFFTGKRILAILVGSKFAEKVFLSEFLPPLFFRAKARWNGEKRHDRVVVERVNLYLVQNLQRVAQGFGHIAEDGVHLGLRLKPLLLGVEHTRRVVEIFSCTETEQMVVSLGVVLIHEMNVVGTDELDAIFTGQLNEHLVGLLL